MTGPTKQFRPAQPASPASASALETQGGAGVVSAIDMRLDLQQKLADGAFGTPIARFERAAGRLLAKLSRRTGPAPAWMVWMLLGLLVHLGSLLWILALGAVDLARGNPKSLLDTFFTIWVPIINLLGFQWGFKNAHRLLQESVLPALQPGQDLRGLRRWLALSTSPRLMLGIGIAVGLFLLGLSWLPYASASGFMPMSILPASLFASLVFGFNSFLLYLIPSFSLLLGLYHYRLFDPDPAHSEVVERIKSVMNQFSYLVAVLSILVSLYTAYLGLFSNLLLSLIAFGWLPLAVLFVMNHISLRRIIVHSKRQKLNALQAEIEKLEAEGDWRRTEWFEQMEKLMDYYERVKGSSESALDLRGGLDFVVQMLLPLLGFGLASLEFFRTVRP